MNIIEGPPPVEPSSSRTARRSYKELFDRLRQSNNGGWLGVSPADISGDAIDGKRAILHQSASVRGLKIQTTHQSGLLYVRLVSPATETTITGDI